MTAAELAAEREASRARTERRLQAGERPFTGRVVKRGFRDFNVGGRKQEEDREAWAYLAPRNDGR